MSARGKLRAQRASVHKRLPAVEEYEERLQTDPRAHAGFLKLRKHGATESDIASMIDTFSSVPRLWAAMRQETVPEERRRRTQLARKIREAADDIEQDRDMRHLTLEELLRNPSGDTATQVEGSAAHQTVPWLLRHIAESWAEANWESSLSIDNALWRREPLHVFAFRFVFKHTAHFLRRRRPLATTALIVSALLDQDIDANSFAHDRTLEATRQRKRYVKQ